MVPYVVSEGLVTEKDLTVFRVVTNLVALLADRPPGVDRLTCHDVCDKLMSSEVVTDRFRAVRGFFGRGPEGERGYHEHSWLESTGDPDSAVLIDPYPVAGVSPLMVFVGGTSPWRALYSAKAGG